MKLSFSTLRLLSQCSYAYEQRQAGIKEIPSESLKVGKEFHEGVAATLRGESFSFQQAEAEEYFRIIEPFLYTIAPLPPGRVEVRLDFEVGGVEWTGFVDAIAGDSLYEFKTSKRMPTSLDFTTHLQASIYAYVLHIERARVVYVTNKAYKVFDVPPLPDVERFLQLISQRFAPPVYNLPTGLFHPWACQTCGFSHSCEFYSYVRATRGVSDEDVL